MPALSSISTVGDKLIVGQVDTSFLTGTGRVSPGTAVLNGPVYCGATAQLGLARATVMIGPPLPGLTVPASLEVTGITNIIGTLNVFAISTFTGLTTKFGTTIKNALSLKNGVDLKNAFNIGNGTSIDNTNAFVHGTFFCTGDVVSSTTTLNKTFAIAVSKKPFDILHPTKKDHRLRYVCLEGPAAEVYFRGRLTNNNKIEIPDYWKGLVDMETLGVQLTPIKMHQELCIDKVEWGQTIIIKNNTGSKIDCYYTVTAERKDVAKNIPEYKGLTPDDYPGDNNEYKL